MFVFQFELGLDETFWRYSKNTGNTKYTAPNNLNCSKSVFNMIHIINVYQSFSSRRSVQLRLNWFSCCKIFVRFEICILALCVLLSDETWGWNSYNRSLSCAEILLPSLSATNMVLGLSRPPLFFATLLMRHPFVTLHIHTGFGTRWGMQSPGGFEAAVWISKNGWRSLENTGSQE